jgi:hypothetical protein
LFTASGPAAPRLVQILNVSDVTLTNNTVSERYPGTAGISAPACVVDTYGGAVQIVVTNSNGVQGNNAFILSGPSGEVIQFRSGITDLSSATLYGQYGGSSSQFTATVPAGATATSAGACGAGNIRFHSYLFGISALPETIPAKNYTTTITMVASPV